MKSKNGWGAITAMAVMLTTTLNVAGDDIKLKTNFSSGPEGFFQGERRLTVTQQNCTVKDDILEFGSESFLAVKLEEPLPLPAGYVAISFSPAASLNDGKEHYLLDLASGGTGLRLWVTRTGQFAFDLREKWRGIFWSTIDAGKFKPGRKYELVFAYSPEHLAIYLDGKRILLKDKPVLPGSWPTRMIIGSLADRKAVFPLSLFALKIGAGTYQPPVKVRTSTYVRPSARTIVPEIGLNVHTRNSPRELPVVVRSGARAIRFHYTWKEVETVKSQYRLPDEAMNFMKELRKTGLEPLMILAYGNPLYNRPGSKPGFGEHRGQNREFAEEFGRYCGWMVKTFGSRGNGQVKYWEIWNEQNEAPAEDFMPILKAAAANIRANDPAAYIVFGGISRMDYDYLKKCFELGAAQYVDAVAFHPYRESTFPEDTYQSERRFGGTTKCYADEVGKFRELLAGYAAPGKRIPLWLTEFGYWTTDAELQLNRAFCITHDVHAKYMLRSIIQNFALGIDKYYIYRAVDSSFFGLTYGPQYLPRPAYFALQHFLTQFPQGKPVEVMADDIKVELTPGSKAAFEKLYRQFDPHVYAFKTAPDTVLLFYWNAGDGKDAYADGNLARANIILPFAVTGSEVACYDLFYGSTLKSYHDGEWKSPIVKTATGCRIENVKYYDGPVMLKLKI